MGPHVGRTSSWINQVIDEGQVSPIRELDREKPPGRLLRGRDTDERGHAGDRLGIRCRSMSPLPPESLDTQHLNDRPRTTGSHSGSNVSATTVSNTEPPRPVARSPPVWDLDGRAKSGQSPDGHQPTVDTQDPTPVSCSGMLRRLSTLCCGLPQHYPGTGGTSTGEIHPALSGRAETMHDPTPALPRHARHRSAPSASANEQSKQYSACKVYGAPGDAIELVWATDMSKSLDSVLRGRGEVPRRTRDCIGAYLSYTCLD